MSEEVIIVGAGLAGLSCAVALQQAGVKYHIIESNDTPGGRVATEDYLGFKLDHGFQVLHTAFPEAKLQLDYPALELGRFYPGALMRLGGKFHKVTDPGKKPLTALRGVFSPVGGFRDKFLARKLHKQMASMDAAEVATLPEQTTLGRLEQYGFSKGMISQFFKPLFSGVFLEDELRTSSKAFDFMFRMMALGDVALPKNGMQEIPRQLASRIPPSRIIYSTRATSVQANSIQLSTGQVLSANYLVLATDKRSAYRMLGKELPQPPKKVTTLYFASQTCPLEEPIVCLNAEGRGPVIHMCVPSMIASGYAPEGLNLISCSVLGEPPFSESFLMETVKLQMREWFGRQVDDWIYLKSFRVGNALPEQPPPLLSPPEGFLKIASGIYLCGDYNGVASMHTGMKSGRLAAGEIIQEIQANS